jgi:hypothetical protein
MMAASVWSGGSYTSQTALIIDLHVCIGKSITSISVSVSSYLACCIRNMLDTSLRSYGVGVAVFVGVRDTPTPFNISPRTMIRPLRRLKIVLAYPAATEKISVYSSGMV